MARGHLVPREQTLVCSRLPTIAPSEFDSAKYSNMNINSSQVETTQKDQSIDDIPSSVLDDCVQLVKANSIEGTLYTLNCCYIIAAALF